MNKEMPSKDVELLNHIHQNADMGRDSINNLIRMTNDMAFAQTLVDQLNEYQSACDRSEQLLCKRNAQPKPAKPMAKMMAHVSSDLKTMADNSPSRLAELMIKGSTMGITNLTRQIKEYNGADKEVMSLAKKQLDIEEKNIEEMKRFL